MKLRVVKLSRVARPAAAAVERRGVTFYVCARLASGRRVDPGTSERLTAHNLITPSACRPPDTYRLSSEVINETLLKLLP